MQQPGGTDRHGETMYSAGTTTTKGEFIATKNATALHKACQVAVQTRRIVLVIGDPGYGKTTAVTEFLKEELAARRETVYYYASVAVRLGGLVRDLATMFQCQHARANAHSLLRAVVEHLEQHPATLLIDEANHLGIPCLEALREIWDKARVPIVLLGDLTLERTLLSPQGRYLELRQLHRRIAARIDLQAMDRDEVTELLKRHWPGIAQDVADVFLVESGGNIGVLCENAIPHVRAIMRKHGATVPSAEMARAAFRVRSVKVAP